MKYSIEPGKQYHIAVGKEDIGQYVILPGDPGRCEKIAAYFDHPRRIAQNREFTTYTGELDGVKVSATSTGIGGPSAAIALEELAACGAHTFIRTGTCGGMDLKVIGGDIVIASGSVRMEGTSQSYAPIEYPAVPDPEVMIALMQAADRLGYKMHIGVVQSKDSFYGQHAPERMPVSDLLQSRWEMYKKMGCLASEMESAALFVASAALRVRCGACFLVMGNQEREKLSLENPVVYDTEASVRTAVEALRILIAQDREKE